MSERWLTILPIFNEEAYVGEVLRQVRRYSADVLVVNDGSTDDTARLLARQDHVCVIQHTRNLGYGAALKSGFEFAIERNYDTVVTIDCDGQHEPQRIPDFVAACRSADVVSGSRYLKSFPGDAAPPTQRRQINQRITEQLNRRFGLRLTDAFCGFKAYRVASLRRFHITEPGYGMPLELWVQTAMMKMGIVELAVPLIYLDEQRSFGGSLDDSSARLQYYHHVLRRSIAAAERRSQPWSTAACGKGPG